MINEYSPPEFLAVSIEYVLPGVINEIMLSRTRVEPIGAFKRDEFLGVYTQTDFKKGKEVPEDKVVLQRNAIVLAVGADEAVLRWSLCGPNPLFRYKKVKDFAFEGCGTRRTLEYLLVGKEYR